ncbi:MAG: M28 family metallopeptidase [Nannocystales bacterium]
MRTTYAAVVALCVACGTPEETGEESSPPSSTSESPSGAVSTESSAQSTTDATETTADPSSSGNAGTAEATTDATNSTGPTDCAPPPDASPAWLRGYLDEVVARMTGAMELSPGVTLAERSTPANRAATADWLDAEFGALGLEVERHAYSAQGTNIVGRLPATEPGGRTLVVGAHFDSVPGSPGANDNATGVAFVLALARYSSSIECRSHDVLFVGFDQEEVGLVGSEAYAAFLVDQGEDILAVHTIDQMGWDQDGDRAIELERADEGLYEVYEAANASLGTPITLHSTGTGFTDHVSFRPYGFAAVGLTEEFVNGDTTPHYHLSTDSYETVNFDLLASTCVLGNTAFAMLIDAG